MTGDEYLWSAKKEGALLRGNLRDFYFPSLLAYLHRKRSTGILTISRDKIEKHVFIRNGTPCGARSNLKTERLGEMLVSQGVITLQKLEQVLDIQKIKKSRFAVTLIEEGIISRHSLFIQSRRLFLSILYSLFGLSEGAYRFEEIDISQDIYCFKVTFTNLMIFGIRQIWDPPVLHSMIGEMDQVPVKTGQFSDIPQKHFTEQEHRVTKAVDSQRTILEVIDASDVEKLTAIKTLLIMLHLDQIQLTTGQEAKRDEALVDVEKSKESTLGFQKYQSCDPKSESAVAGDDFLLPPEGGRASSPFLEPQAEASGDHLGPFPWIEIARTGQKKESETDSIEVEESTLDKTGDSGSLITPLIGYQKDEEALSAWDHKGRGEDLEMPERETEVSFQPLPDLPAEADDAPEETEEKTENSFSPEKLEPEEDHAEKDMALDTAEPVQDKSSRKKPPPRKKAGLLYLIALVLATAFGFFFMTPWSSDLKDRLYSNLYDIDSRSLPVSGQITEEQSQPPLTIKEGEKTGMEVALSESTEKIETSEPLAPEIANPVRMDEEDLPKPQAGHTMDLPSEEGSLEKSIPEFDETPNEQPVTSTLPPSQPEKTVPALPETDDTPSVLARVLGIHHEKEPDYLRVIIELDKPVTYKIYELTDKKMVFLSLADTHLSPNLTKAPIYVSGHRLKRIRAGQYKPDKARVAFDFEEMSKISLFSLEDPFRIVLVISDQ